MELITLLNKEIASFNASLLPLFLQQYMHIPQVKDFYSLKETIEKALKEHDHEMIAIFGHDFLDACDIMSDVALAETNNREI